MTQGTGVPVGLALEGANRHDMKMTHQRLESVPIKRPQPGEGESQNLCLDKAYDYDQVRELVKEFGFTAHIRARGEEAQALKKEAGFKERSGVQSTPLGGGENS